MKLIVFLLFQQKTKAFLSKTEICVYRADIPTICMEMADLSISTDDISVAVKASVKDKHCYLNIFTLSPVSPTKAI